MRRRRRAQSGLVALVLSFGLLACGSPDPGSVALPTEAVETKTPPQTDQPGLLGRLFRGNPATLASAPVEDPLPAATTGPAPETPQARPTGLLGLLGGGSAGAAERPAVPQAEYPDVSFGTRVPYGQIARVCDVPNRSLGKVTGRYPARGAARFRLHDSTPGGQGLRTMYLTGFDDGCARQFTASLALFGSFQMHELLRYGLPAQVQPYSETDDRYEVLKRQVCGARKGKPCGAAMSGFARDGVFVSIYERFEGNPRWKNLLLYQGQVVAFDLTGP